MLETRSGVGRLHSLAVFGQHGAIRIVALWLQSFGSGGVAVAAQPDSLRDSAGAWIGQEMIGVGENYQDFVFARVDAKQLGDIGGKEERLQRFANFSKHMWPQLLLTS